MATDRALLPLALVLLAAGARWAPAEEAASGPAAAEAAPVSSAADAPKDDADALAKQLQNPVADLVSLPIQTNVDFRIGAQEHGERFLINVQPVIPFKVTSDLNVIARLILPLINQKDVFGDEPTDGPLAGQRQSGLGDTTLSMFASPAEPGPGGLIWGVGPILLAPTGSQDVLGTGKWGVGPTLVGLIQLGNVTVGGLFNHIWSFTGRHRRDEVNGSFLQPFLAYTFGGGWAGSVSWDLSYDWKHSDWTIPMNFGVSKVLNVFGQLVSFSVGGRVYLTTPDHDGPEWGLRFGVTLLFPRGK